MAKDVYEAISNAQKTGTEKIKRIIPGLIDAAVLVAMVFLQFGTFRFSIENAIAAVTTMTVTFVAALIVSKNGYNTGEILGKQTDLYVQARERYSAEVDGITGEQMLKLEDFCNEYTEEAAKAARSAILIAVPFERFDSEFEVKDENGNISVHPPYKTMRYKDLKAELGEIRAKSVVKARRHKVKGLHDRDLLDSRQVADNTDVGETETQLEAKTFAVSTGTMLVCTAFWAAVSGDPNGTFTLATAGWLLYQWVYILSRGWSHRMKAYKNMTVFATARFNNQADKLKQFKAWYKKKYPENNPVGGVRTSLSPAIYPLGAEPYKYV